MRQQSAGEGRLSDLSPFVYGTTRLGDESCPLAERVKTARAAMEAGVWFHTSHTYGDAFRVLRAAFDEDRAHVPPLIVKIGWSSIPEIRDVIRQNSEPLGVEQIALGQLCLGEPLAAEFRAGGPCYDGLRQIRDEGLVARYVLEVWPWNSDVAVDALQSGYAEGLVDGYIFYFNPLQRFASNRLFDLIQERDQAIVAMRTVGGGPVHRQRDVPGAAPDYLRERAAQVARLFERSGCPSWTEFCVRYVLGVRQVRATVGATSRTDHLAGFLADLGTGALTTVVATGQLVGEGFDCPSLSALFLATPVSFNGRLTQYVGRVSRTSPGKARAFVVDYRDDHGMLWSGWNKRSATYRELGLSQRVPTKCA